MICEREAMKGAQEKFLSTVDSFACSISNKTSQKQVMQLSQQLQNIIRAPVEISLRPEPSSKKEGFRGLI